jgi:glycosyltransferase involved in cell wall biosynthesis
MNLAPHAVTIVLATYNERENVGLLLPRLLDLDLNPRVIVVDDTSPDGTGDVVREIGTRHPGRVVLLSRASKEGYGSAMIAGLSKAIEQPSGVVVTLDADLSHDPSDIPNLIAALEDADVAIGSRYRNGVRVINWGPKRLLLSLGANRYVRLVLGLPVEDCTSGFRAYRAEALASLDLGRIRTRGYAFLVELLEMTTRLGYLATEVPIVYTERTAGRSKMSRAVILEAVFRPWTLRLGRLFRNPARRLGDGRTRVVQARERPRNTRAPR